MIKRLLPLLFALSLVKRVALKPVYLQVIPLIFGVLQAVKCSKILQVFIPLFLMVLLNIVSCWGSDPSVVAIFRNIQLFLLLCFSHYCYFHLSDEILKKMLFWILLLSVITFCADILFAEPNPRRYWLLIPQYYYIVGEPTLSSFVYLVAILIATIKRWYKFIPFFIVFGILTYCRGFVLSVMVFCLLSILRHYFPRMARWGSIGILTVLYFYPLLMRYIHHFVSPNSLKFLYDISTKRTGIHAAYMQHVDFFGVGYFNSLSYFSSLKDVVMSFLKSTTLINGFPMHDPHNLFIQTIVEFGVVGYVLFGLFLYRFYISIKSTLPVREGVVSLFLFTSMLGVYNEVLLWLFIGWVCRCFSDNHQIIDCKNELRKINFWMRKKLISQQE